LIDIKIVNAKVFGYDEDVNCICISGKKISYVGSDKGQQAKKITDIEGRLIIPGFVDCHTHLINLSSSTVMLQGLDRDEVIEKMKERAKSEKKKVVMGRGWDESQWKDKSYLTRDEVDSIPKPAVLIRVDGHMAVANSKALEILRMGDRKDGIIREEEMKLIRKLQWQSDEEIRKSLVDAFRECFSQGITCVRDIVDKRTFDVYARLMNDELKPKVRLVVYHDEFEDYMVNEKEFWGVKVFMDGSIGAKTAAVSGWPEKNLLINREELKRIASRFWEKDIPIAAHAIGDVAIETAIQVLSRREDLRNTVEHFELVREEFLSGMKKLIACCQPNFLQWSGKGGLYEQRLGKEWLSKNNPYRLIIDKGIKLAFGSDCMPLGPSYGIHLAVNSEHVVQRINIDEAISSYTESGAYLCKFERRCGVIVKGMDADLAIFDADYLKNTRDKRPFATLLEGKVVYGSLHAG
jgi:predicted amidohydrolase YtcJ